jgi:hypothetical protein
VPDFGGQAMYKTRYGPNHLLAFSTLHRFLQDRRGGCLGSGVPIDLYHDALIAIIGAGLPTVHVTKHIALRADSRQRAGPRRPAREDDIKSCAR